MNSGNRTFRAAAAFLGAALLCGCTAARQEGVTAPAPGEPVVRLPVGTPLKIEQTAPPPPAERSIAPTEVQEGRDRSLKLFEVEYGHGKTGPAAAEAPSDPSDTEQAP